MENINELSTEQIQQFVAIYRQLHEQEQQQRADRSEQVDLPEEILDKLDNTSSVELKNKLKKFHRDTLKYDRGNWTKSGAINKLFLAELKSCKVDAIQTITAIYKGADRLRTTARTSTEVYQDLLHIIDNGGNEEDMQVLLEKVKRLAIYSFATGKEMDKDAKDLATRTIKLPENMQYLKATKKRTRFGVLSRNCRENPAKQI